MIAFKKAGSIVHCPSSYLLQQKSSNDVPFQKPHFPCMVQARIRALSHPWPCIQHLVQLHKRRRDLVASDFSCKLYNVNNKDDNTKRKQQRTRQLNKFLPTMRAKQKMPMSMLVHLPLRPPFSISNSSFMGLSWLGAMV
jgi:hypothetical protein